MTVLSFLVWNTTTSSSSTGRFDGNRNAALPAGLVGRYMAGLAIMAGAGAALAAAVEGAREFLYSMDMAVPGPILLICAAAVAFSVRRLVSLQATTKSFILPWQNPPEEIGTDRNR